MSTRGFKSPVGISLVIGLIWTSAAVGDGPMFPGAHYAAGDESIVRTAFIRRRRDVSRGDPRWTQAIVRP